MPHGDGEWRDWALLRLKESITEAGRGERVHVLRFPDARVGLDLVLVDPTGGPTGSLKDWYVRDLYWDAILRGRLQRGMRVFDGTSGSTGIAEAYWARLLGLSFTAVMPEDTTPAKQELIRAQGGECYLVPGSASITDVARDLAHSHHGYYMGQFQNAGWTPDAHGPSSLHAIAREQMSRLRHPDPKWTIVPAGTGRTLTLFALGARAHGVPTGICVADFADSALCRAWRTGDESATGDPSAIEGDARRQLEPGIDFRLIDDVIGVTDAQAIATIRWVEQLTGERFGGTTGRVLYAALLKLARMRELGEQGSVLVVAGDDGERYEDSLYSSEYLAQHVPDVRDASRTLRHLLADINSDLT